METQAKKTTFSTFGVEVLMFLREKVRMKKSNKLLLLVMMLFVNYYSYSADAFWMWGENPVNQGQKAITYFRKKINLDVLPISAELFTISDDSFFFMSMRKK